MRETRTAGIAAHRLRDAGDDVATGVGNRTFFQTRLEEQLELVESGEILKHPANPDSDALVAYIRALGLKEGDQQTLIVKGPDGAVLSEYKAPALDRAAPGRPAGCGAIFLRLTPIRLHLHIYSTIRLPCTCVPPCSA